VVGSDETTVAVQDGEQICHDTASSHLANERETQARRHVVKNFVQRYSNNQVTLFVVN